MFDVIARQSEADLPERKVRGQTVKALSLLASALQICKCNCVCCPYNINAIGASFPPSGSWVNRILPRISDIFLFMIEKPAWIVSSNIQWLSAQHKCLTGTWVPGSQSEHGQSTRGWFAVGSPLEIIIVRKSKKKSNFRAWIFQVADWRTSSSSINGSRWRS